MRLVLTPILAIPLALSAVRAEEERRRAGAEVTNVIFPERIGRNLSGRGGWLAAYLEIRTSSKDPESVVLQGAVSSDGKLTHTGVTRVEVAPGAPRRAWIYLWGAPGLIQQTATVDARTTAGLPIRTGDRWQLSSFEGQESLCVLVVGENLPDDAPWPSGTTIRPERTSVELGESVSAVPARALPDSVLGYHGADLVVVRDLGGDRLEPRQLDALRSWVYLGGTVILAPSSRSDDLFRSELAAALLADRLVDPVPDELEPRVVRIAGAAAGEGLGPALKRIMGRDAEGIPIAEGQRPKLMLLDPLLDRAPLEIRGSGPDEGSTRQDRLYAQIATGEGQVGIVTFAGTAALRETSVPFLRTYWGSVLRLSVSRQADSGFSLRAARRTLRELDAKLNDPSRDVGVPFFAALVAGYLIVMGPLLYYFLKRRRRLHAVIWVEPLVVVIYLGVILAVGYVTKGVLTKTRMWTLISQHRGDALALRQSYLTIFSGSEATYRIECPRGFLLQPIFRNPTQERPMSLTWGAPGEATALALDGFGLAHWEQGHLVNLEVLDLGGEGVTLETLEAGEKPDAPPRSVRLTNRLSQTIVEGIIRSAEAIVPFSRIEPGRSAVVRLDAGQVDDPESRKLPWRRLLAGLPDFQACGFELRGNLVLAALLDRSDVDFRLDQRSSLREKIDIYVLHAEP